MTMTSRQRLQEAIEHRPADRVPMDFGAAATTGIAASLLYAIKRHLGLLEEGERIYVVEPYQMLGAVDEALREALGIDTLAVPLPTNMFGFPNDDWKEWTMFDGTPVWVPGLFNTEPDPQGNIPMYAQGDRAYPPCALMPAGGFYFDSLPRQKPIDEDRLDPRDNMEEFQPFDDEMLRFLGVEAQRLYDATDAGLVMVAPGMALGDIALVPGPFLKDPKGIRDVAEWYMSTAIRRDYLKAVFQHQVDVGKDNLARLYRTVGDRVQVIFMSGTDYGTQNSTMLSSDAYRDLYLPYQRALNDWVHEHTPWKTFIHSCGAVEPLIPCFIEAGFDILNPVQCSATGMAPQVLKEKYGEDIVFWGGGIDTQKTLPFGTPDQVREEVRRWVGIFKQGGGYVFNSIHNLQARTPVENALAMFEAFREVCRY